MLSDFLFRVRQYAHENRARLVRSLVIAAGALILAAFIYYAIESWQRARFEKRAQALDALYRDADARAKEHKARADDLTLEIDAKQLEAQFLAKRAAGAETALRNARGKVVTLREEYETIRYRDVPDTPVSVADVCSKLAGLGYKCD